MKEISIEALKGKTVGEIIKLSKQVQDLPIGFKLTYQKPKTKGCGRLFRPDKSIRCGQFGCLCEICSREQTAEELVEEIINEK